MVNCFLVRDHDGLTLVDAGLARGAPGIVAATKSVGAPLRRIVLTHAHLDHVGSLDSLVRQFPGIPVAIGQRESRLLRRDFLLEPGESGKKLIGFPGTRTNPTLYLVDGDRVSSLQAVLCPGHTPGHMAFLDTRDGTLIAGDAFTTQAGMVAASVFKFYFPSGIVLVEQGIGCGKRPESPRFEACAPRCRPRQDRRVATCCDGQGS